MATLRELTSFRYKKGLGQVGIEVETEAAVEYRYPDLLRWTAHADGSLRNFGVEYVLSKPLNVSSGEYEAALEEFRKFASKQVFLSSTYTSVHVHLNFVDRDVRELANFISLYVLFENMLTRYCGPDRDGNLFCLKTQNAEANYLLYRDLIFSIANGQTSYFVRSLSQNRYKYSSLNIVPLVNLGSVEVRTHPGTTDVELIDRWVKILMCLYNKANEYENPIEILQDYYKSGDSFLFVNKIFGEYAQYFSRITLDEDIISNLIYVKTMSLQVKDWKEFGVLKEVPVFSTETLTLSREEARTLDLTRFMATFNNFSQATVATTTLTGDL